MHPYYAELISTRLIAWKLVSLNGSPRFDAMIRNTREIISPLSTRILVQFAYSPITIIRDAFNIKSSLIQRLIEHEPMIQMPS